MGLSDIVGNAGLGLFAEIALVIFFVVFVGIVLYVVLRRKGYWDHARHLPLDDDEPIRALKERRR